MEGEKALKVDGQLCKVDMCNFAKLTCSTSRSWPRVQLRGVFRGKLREVANSDKIPLSPKVLVPQKSITHHFEGLFKRKPMSVVSNIGSHSKVIEFLIILYW